MPNRYWNAKTTIQMEACNTFITRCISWTETTVKRKILAFLNGGKYRQLIDWYKSSSTQTPTRLDRLVSGMYRYGSRAPLHVMSGESSACYISSPVYTGLSAKRSAHEILRQGYEGIVNKLQESSKQVKQMSEFISFPTIVCRSYFTHISTTNSK